MKILYIDYSDISKHVVLQHVMQHAVNKFYKKKHCRKNPKNIPTNIVHPCTVGQC